MNVRATPRVTQAAEGLQRRRFTVAEIEAIVAAGVIDDDERFELIGGEVVPMPPKGIRHELVKAALNRVWQKAAPDGVNVAQETTFRVSDDSFLEPDFVIYARETGLASIAGSNVLLVVEVADSSLSYDLGRKARFYASYGVRELWVIDAIRLRTRLFSNPTDTGYQRIADAEPEALLTSAFAPAAFAVKLAELELA